MSRKALFVTGAVAVAGAALGWPAWAAVTWMRYGHAARVAAGDPLVDRWLTAPEVAETHATRVAAPASIAYPVATGLGLEASAVVRTVVGARERMLGAGDAAPWPSGGLVTQLRAWGWGVLDERPGRAVVLGAVTRPWEGDVRFRALPPGEFAAFAAPGFVKIVVAIAVDSLGADASVARVHTRVATTDASARARFRRYWAVFSPGILLIRRAHLRAVRREAERRYGIADVGAARAGAPETGPAQRPRLARRAGAR